MISLTRQVNKFLSLNKWTSSIRFTHDDKKTIYPLKSRSLVKVSGPEASLFLQGLITNDMNHFEDGAQSMYAMFLSNKGRVLYDTLVHKWRTENNDEFMLECDKSIQHTLQKYLKRFKLKRKLKIEDVSEAFKIWALIAPADFDHAWEPDINLNINVYKDPRLTELGYRLITTADVGQIEIQKAVGRDTVVESDDEEYVALRYRLGVSEGSKDLVPGTNFPLEANCDYLHGVSFHKGCYIGQELTARVHHTGVVRKRIMPIQFLDIRNEEDLQSDATISSGTTNLGKFKGRVGTCGLGLVRIKEALQAKIINIGRNNIEIIRPHWWPIEAPKEKLTALKSEKDTKDN